MIKKFIQNNKIILLTVIITALVTSAVASGYFVIRNEKQNANQKIKSLQKSIIDLQAKAKKSTEQKMNQKTTEEIPVTEDLDQPAPIVKKSVEIIPVETAPIEEKTVPCLTYANTTVKVSKAECEMIKQKNKRSENIDEEYQGCVSACEAIYRASIPVTSESQYNNVFGNGAYDDKVSECKDKRDDCSKDCLKTRNNKMKKLWK